MIIMKLAISHLLCVGNGIIVEEKVEKFEEVFGKISLIFILWKHLHLLFIMPDGRNYEILDGVRLFRNAYSGFRL